MDESAITQAAKVIVRYLKRHDLTAHYRQLSLSMWQQETQESIDNYLAGERQLFRDMQAVTTFADRYYDDIGCVVEAEKMFGWAFRRAMMYLMIGQYVPSLISTGLTREDIKALK